jgi:hypothetical protein
MARRATLDRGMSRDRSGETDDDLAAQAPDRRGRGGSWSRSQSRAQAPGGPAAGSAPWRGSGGRWLVWTLRVIAWAVLLVIGYRGVLAIVQGTGPASAPPPAPAASPGAAFPETAAEAYALQFGSAYLNFSPAAQTRRAQVLAAMLPPGADPNVGWNGAGQQVLTSEQVAGIQVKGAHTAVVTLLAMINGSDLIELGVPLYTSGGRFVVTGAPALLPAPRAAVPPPAPAASADANAQEQLTTQLRGFFTAYASGQQLDLDRFLVPGASVTGLNGVVTFNNIVSVSAPPGGSTRHITAVVSWTINSSDGVTFSGSKKHQTESPSPDTLQMAYDMTVVEQNGTWDIQSIGASSELPGPP